jgi:radical SAM superfamily enzyme YgiQ (UPF0313 family)
LKYCQDDDSGAVLSCNAGKVYLKVKNILFISPVSDNEALWITGDENREVRNNMVPLGLATIAGLTPGVQFTVDIWDELVHGIIDPGTRFAREYDLVGITGYKTHLARCRQLAAIFRARSIPVAIGGPGVSGTPDHYRGDFDSLFIGEAERTWPQFLRDWQAGVHRSEYRQIEKPDLTDSPLPKWDSIVPDFPKYAMGCVQTTRGCPFDCEFCDVIYLFGRRPRHKPIANVLEEIRVIERLGMSSVFLSDDDFIGDPAYAKKLLRELIPLNNAFPRPLSYSTQLTLSVSRDPELLELLADANCNLLFVGIETPNEESIKETNKRHNLSRDMVAEVHRILSYGMAIRAGIIVGFDHDGPDIFDMQCDFIQKACLPSLGINMLKAPLGTKLWARLRLEGRVVSMPKAKDMLGHPRSYTNIIPKLLTRVELMQGYKALLQKVYSWPSFTERICGFVSLANRPPRVQGSVTTKEEMVWLGNSMVGEPEGREAIAEMTEHTIRRAPFLMRRVKELVIQHAKYRESLEKLLLQLDRQIELESTGKLVFQLDSRPVPVPSAFHEGYKKAFDEVHRRVYANLADKGREPEALVEVFVDFLVRWGDDFHQFEPHHFAYLREICDRTCARFNGQPPEEFVPVEAGGAATPDVRGIRLSEDVLKSVEQELIKLA